MIKVAPYIRVSTSEQAEYGYSIDAQRDALQKYCKEQGWAIFNTYIDRGISAKTVSNRPALQQLLQDAEQQRFQMVLVWKINRLARNAIELLEMVEHFKRHGVAFRSLTEAFETETPLGQFTLQMMSAVGELERKTISDNLKMGRIQRNKQGKYCGTTIFGYEVQTLEYHSARRQVTTLAVLPEEAALVQHIFILYSKGLGKKAIVNRLNRSGFTTKEGKPFSLGTIQKILRNVVYVGKVRYQDSQSKEVKIVDGEHEPIIPLDLWEWVQQRLERKTGRPQKKNPYDSLLTSLLRCPVCNSGTVSWQAERKLKSGSMKWYRYYMCGTYHNQGSTACKPNLIPADAIEQLVLDQLKELILHPKLLGDIVEQMNWQTKVLIQSLQEQVKVIEKLRKECESKRARIFELFEQDTIDQKELSSRLKTIKQTIDRLNSEQSERQAQIEEHKKKEISFPDIQKALENFEILWEPSHASQKRELLRAIIDQITLHPNRELNSVQIHFNQVLLDVVLPVSQSKQVS